MLAEVLAAHAFLNASLLVFFVIASALAETRVGEGADRFGVYLFLRHFCGYFNMGSVVEAQREQITVEEELHRISHRGILDELDHCARDDAHIEEMLTQRSVAANGSDEHALSYFYIA